MKRLVANLLISLLIVFTIFNTSYLIQRILDAERPLLLAYKDPKDKYIYPAKLEDGKGRWVEKSDKWQWEELSINEYKQLKLKSADEARRLKKPGVAPIDWFDSYATLKTFDTKPADLPGIAKHTLIRHGKLWKWKTTLDNSLLSETKRWFAKRFLLSANPKVTTAQVGAARTVTNANIINYLLTSALILIPGIFIYRRLKE